MQSWLTSTACGFNLCYYNAAVIIMIKKNFVVIFVIILIANVDFSTHSPS